jgi:hypothetical protein
VLLSDGKSARRTRLPNQLTSPSVGGDDLWR